MSAPIWKTAPGTLGTIPEQQFYELKMVAINPEDPEGNDPESLGYKIVAGSLPPGLVMYENGSIQGKPKNTYYIRGVPFDVKKDTTNTFCCRATNKYTGEVTDRTFSITVTGEDPPQILTNAGQLAKVFDGDEVNIQLEAVDLDVEPVSWKLVKGRLPPGLSLDTITGMISGYVSSVPLNDLGNNVGWSASSGWEQYPWDYASKASSAAYQFGIQATDGKMYDGKEYTIYVLSHDSMTADNSILTADEIDLVTADKDNKRLPVLLTKPADLGTYAHDNYFAYEFLAKDFDGDRVSFSLLVGDGIGFDNELNGFDSTLMDFGDFKLPPGLTLNTDTGWLYGQIPRSTAAQTEYKFAVRVYKTDYPTYQSGLTFFTMTIVNDLNRLVTWLSPYDLGVMKGGDISEKFVAASNAVGTPMNYTLVSGKLPQGLRLNFDGLIVGRTSFEVSLFDGGDTTFDKNVRELGALIGETTLDRKYEFTVKASNANGEMASNKKFSIIVEPAAHEPYESLYLKAQPGLADKEIINAVFRNSDIIDSADLYRNSDPYFGRSRDLRLLLMSGIKASSAEEYITAMATNHYRKNIMLGEYDWAIATNPDGSIAYEIVYIKAMDPEMLDNKTAPRSIDLTDKINRNVSVDDSDLSVSSALTTIDGKGDRIAYPSSLANMRALLNEKLTRNVREPLPRWMISRQLDGTVRGWQPVIPVAYVKPGIGAKVVFKLNRQSNIDIKLVSFDVDRYVWDMNLSKNYDAVTNTYQVEADTTFDLTSHLDDAIETTVDFAVEVPFNEIDGMPRSYLDNVLGGLDGVITNYENKTIVFAKQEQYTGFLGEEDGWVRYNSIWEGKGWDDPTDQWDAYEIIPGANNLATDLSADSSDITCDDITLTTDQYTTLISQRSGVWRINLDVEAGVLRLTHVRNIIPGDSIYVNSGYKYGGLKLIYGPLIQYDQGETVPSWHVLGPQQAAVQTLFDGNSTKFKSYITVYEEPDQSDKYLAFPRKNIWA